MEDVGVVLHGDGSSHFHSKSLCYVTQDEVFLPATCVLPFVLCGLLPQLEISG